MVDALGNPLRFVVSEGQRADVKFAESLIEGYGQAGAVVADKAYDADRLIEVIGQMEARAVIPPKKNRKEPRKYDKNLYKDRNKVERYFGRVKHYRRLATRYEKTARNFLAFWHIAAAITLTI